jgi:hypothetical protein
MADETPIHSTGQDHNKTTQAETWQRKLSQARVQFGADSDEAECIWEKLCNATDGNIVSLSDVHYAYRLCGDDSLLADDVDTNLLRETYATKDDLLHDLSRLDAARLAMSDDARRIELSGTLQNDGDSLYLDLSLILTNCRNPEGGVALFGSTDDEPRQDCVAVAYRDELAAYVGRRVYITADLYDFTELRATFRYTYHARVDCLRAARVLECEVLRKVS